MLRSLEPASPAPAPKVVVILDPGRRLLELALDPDVDLAVLRAANDTYERATQGGPLDSNPGMGVA